MMEAHTINPTNEQLHILQHCRESNDNIMISALAGCGKSSTLEMIERAVDTRPILLLAFNKKIAEDASKRMLTTTTVRTFNSLGHRIWAKSCAKNLTLNTKKVPDILRAIIDEVKDRETKAEIWESFWPIVHGVGLAKALGYVPDGKFPNAKHLCTRTTLHAALEESPDDLIADLIDAVLTRSIQASYQGSVDFNDQIYMPALFGGTYPRFPLVLVDEYQDLNPTNHEMLARLVKHRLIGVGDDFQSIYQFRGAKVGGMAAAQAAYKMTPLDLSTSFRCPSEIVRAARWRAPKFKWIKEGGHVEVLHRLSSLDIPESATFICRNNAPLFRLAMQLLSSGRSVQVAGSDIGPKVIGIMRKLGPPELSKESLLSAGKDWLAERLARGSTTAEDIFNCIEVFAAHGSNLGQAIAYAEHLFAQKGAVRFMTGHKAKGLEFPIVYVLDEWLCRDDEQDNNLRYVMATRSSNQLYYINSRDIQW